MLQANTTGQIWQAYEERSKIDPTGKRAASDSYLLPALLIRYYFFRDKMLLLMNLPISTTTSKPTATPKTASHWVGTSGSIASAVRSPGMRNGMKASKSPAATAKTSGLLRLKGPLRYNGLRMLRYAKM